MRIFLDESGDLGFTQKSSKYFVIGLLIAKNEKQIENCVKRTRNTKLKRKLRDVPELKFNKSDDAVRKYLLGCISSKDIEIHGIILKKHRVYDYLKDHRNKIYNYITGFLMDKIVTSPEERQLVVILDKFLSKESREDYNQYIKGKLSEFIKKTVKIEVEHKDSVSERCLQAVDFIAGAIFNKYERNDDRYYAIIEPKIKTIKELFK
ncbi:MAG: DUF3800 domain-containing protein [Candidatus Aenigmarchaeota archaeon]|nr:DUF3800 domain-containing protein [Candidatus Aenigmarchaeota archaeon]